MDGAFLVGVDLLDLFGLDFLLLHGGLLDLLLFELLLHLNERHFRLDELLDFPGHSQGDFLQTDLDVFLGNFSVGLDLHVDLLDLSRVQLLYVHTELHQFLLTKRPVVTRFSLPLAVVRALGLSLHEKHVLGKSKQPFELFLHFLGKDVHVSALLVEKNGVVPNEVDVLFELLVGGVVLFLELIFDGLEIHGILDDGEVVGDLEVDGVDGKEKRLAVVVLFEETEDLSEALVVEVTFRKIEALDVFLPFVLLDGRRLQINFGFLDFRKFSVAFVGAVQGKASGQKGGNKLHVVGGNQEVDLELERGLGKPHLLRVCVHKFDL